MAQHGKRLLEVEGIEALLAALRSRGHRLLGPTVRDQAIVYDDIDAVADLPRGWTDEQEAGHYRLARRDDEALFGYAVGPQSWKRFLHPPIERLWQARRDGDGVEVTTEPVPEETLAFIGVRACEIARHRHPGPRLPRRPARRHPLRGAPRATISSSRSIAASPAAPASAPRWARARAPRPASTSR